MLFKKQPESKRYKKYLYIMCIKTWIGSTCMTARRVFQIGHQSGSWFGEQKRCNDEVHEGCIGEYNHALMDPGASVLLYALYALVFFAVILNILCFKWKRIACYLFYLECLTRVVAVSFPNVAGYEDDEIKYVLIFCVNWVVFYTDSGNQIIVSTLTCAYHFYFGLMAAYLRPVTGANILLYMGSTIMVFLCGCIVGMIIKQVMEVN